ncbi:MAG: ATP-binding protein [Patescibacteria group bacterium]|nr:ATP-binding protein [Patescibacteria group bacterium]
MDNKEIIAVIGARQCGKTTMINHILKQYKNVKSITFENINTKLLFEEDIESFIELYVDGYNYLFIDEVQYAKNSGKILKYIFDTQDIKIIISGSSSTDISIKSLKYLVGRIFIFHLHTFSFSEFLQFRDEKIYKIYIKKKFGNQINQKLLKFIHEFMKFGGYPRVVISKTDEEKKIVLENIYNTYLLREIKEILQLSKNDKLIKLLKALSLQIGNIINYNELSQITGFDFKTLKKYLYILEETYICQRCNTFFTNKRNELVKAPKIYFFDNGFRNQCVNNFDIQSQELGAYYENLIFSEFQKKSIKLKYWRTHSKTEVDFIQDEKIPIEIKTKPKITKAFLSFIDRYKPEKGYIVSQIEKESIIKNNCKIYFKSFAQFI